MKVAIDTRYDTLEEALAVVALAFETSAKGATKKPNRAAKQRTSGRKPGGQTVGPAEATAPDTATEEARTSKTTGSRRRTATKKSASADGSGVKTKRVAAKKANPAQTQSPTPANVAPPGQSDKIRAWARSQGMQVADAGRMSAAVIAAYRAHHN